MNFRIIEIHNNYKKKFTISLSTIVSLPFQKLHLNSQLSTDVTSQNSNNVNNENAISVLWLFKTQREKSEGVKPQDIGGKFMSPFLAITRPENVFS